MDILKQLEDLKKQATTERSHFYTGRVLEEAMYEIRALRAELIPRKYHGCCLSCGNRYHFLYCKWMEHPEKFGCDNWSKTQNFEFQGIQPRYIPESEPGQKRSSSEG